VEVYLPTIDVFSVCDGDVYGDSPAEDAMEVEGSTRITGSVSVAKLGEVTWIAVSRRSVATIMTMLFIGLYHLR